jgi:signal transduction histidine kinase
MTISLTDPFPALADIPFWCQYHGAMQPIGKMFERHSRPVLMLLCLAFVGLIGLMDYRTGFEVSLSVFYLLTVGFAAWFIGRSFALFLSVLSVAVSFVADVKAGMRYSSSFIPIWNATILAASYAVVVWLLGSLRSLQRELESRVQQRTVALTREMIERERLEREILEIGERERRRIGRDLHDSLCQHLTGTALAGQVLEEKLAAKSLAESADAGKVVELVEGGITLARDLARGIYPVEVDAEGLMVAFREFAENTGKWSKTECVFECDSPVLVHDASTASHLYRIAQEAVRNAIQHGRANRVVISLSDRGGALTLTIEDDGTGLPENWQKGQGLGTRIMAHRAAMMGAELSIEPNPTGGTFVKCSFPPDRPRTEKTASTS